MRKLLLVLGLATVGWAQQPEEGIERYLIPPELIMTHDSDLGITEDQRQEIVGIVSEAQGKFTGLHWELRSQMRDMRELLAEPSTTEAAALDQLEAVLDAESKVKRTQLSMLIRVRRVLNADQQRRALELRGEMERRQRQRGGYGFAKPGPAPRN